MDVNDYRVVVIDGMTRDIRCCDECPCYDGGDNREGEVCKHPRGDGHCAPGGGKWSEQRFGENCPLMRFQNAFVAIGARESETTDYEDDVTMRTDFWENKFPIRLDDLEAGLMILDRERFTLSIRIHKHDSFIGPICILDEDAVEICRYIAGLFGYEMKRKEV